MPKSLQDAEYLAAGLGAMCRTLECSSAEGPSWFSAHYALAVMGARWTARETGFDAEASAEVERHLSMLTAERAALFAPLDLEADKAEPARVGELVETLRPGLRRHVRAGHNVIYTAYAVKALLERPGWATPGVVERLTALIRETNEPLDRADAPIPSADECLPYEDEADMVARVFHDLAERSFEPYEVWKVGLGHVLTHAHALVELGRAGYADVAREGFDAHRAHFHMSRTDRSRTDLMQKQNLDVDPLSLEFWQRKNGSYRSWEFGHTFKYTYSFFRVQGLVEDRDIVARARENLRWLV